MSFDIYDSAMLLFNRFNVKKQTDDSDEVLDATEISKAKQCGFNLFDIKEDMNEDDFISEYYCIAPSDDESKQFEQKINDIHVKYLQIQYNTSEVMKESETIEEYEQRIILNDELSKLPEEDISVYEDAINNSDNYEKLCEICGYFYEKYEDDYPTVQKKLSDLESNIIQKECEFADTLPQNEREILDLITSSCYLSENVSAKKNIINEAKEIVNKYPDNIKKDGFIQFKMKEVEEHLSQYTEYLDFFDELAKNKVTNDIQSAFETIIDGDYKHLSVEEAKETIKTASEYIKNYPKYIELVQPKIDEAKRFMSEI